jgi:peptidoglycan hydrolase-like protein with peptidoglycan-binding domain
VNAVQCLLKQKHLYDGKVSGAFTRPTARAVRSFQGRRHLAVTGVVNANTWTVLLAEGTSPVLKRGSASNAVRRVQRALNAATGAGLNVTGVFGGPTTQAVRGYQGNRHIPRTGVVAADTWAELEAGRR